MATELPGMPADHDYHFNSNHKIITADGFRPLLVPGFRIIGVGNTKGWSLVNSGELPVVYNDAGRAFLAPETLENFVAKILTVSKPAAPRPGLEKATSASLATRRKRAGGRFAPV